VLIPAIADSIRIVFDETCATMAQGGTMANECLCTAGESGESLRGLFDKLPYNCVIANDEVDMVLSGFLTPDIDADGGGSFDALSVGFGVTAVGAAFTPPGS
jgi:hypothetical protein